MEGEIVDANDCRDELGRVVRRAWVRWAETRPDPKPSWLVPYDDLSEPDKEADRQIAEAVLGDMNARRIHLTLERNEAPLKTMSELPPGPWTTHLEGHVALGELFSARDADGERVDLTSEGVRRAIEALPLLVAKARELVELLEDEGAMYHVTQLYCATRRVLDMIDGVG
jgi:hypothetical protein